MKHWKTTLAGILLGAAEGVNAISNWDQFTPRQLAFHFGMAVLIALLGYLAKDHTQDG